MNWEALPQAVALRRATHRLVTTLEGRQRALDLLILATPTGSDRALLTEANIHLLMAISKLKEIKP